MKTRHLTFSLLLLVFLLRFQGASAQLSYYFELKVPIIDTVGGVNQGATYQYYWVEPDTGSLGTQLFLHWGSVRYNGEMIDTVSVLGVGTGALWFKTIDCYGDTLAEFIPFDSSDTHIVADTMFICPSTYATICSTGTSFVQNTPGDSVVSFQANPVGIGGLSQITWDFGDGTSSTALHPIHTYAYNGNFVVQHTADFGNGCAAWSGTTTVQVSGVVNPGCNTNISPSWTGNSMNFYVNHWATGTPVSYQWDFGDGQTFIASSSPVNHAYQVNGNVPVCVVTTFSDGCMDTACIVIYVYWSNPNCQADFGYVVNAPTVTFQDSSTAATMITLRRWDFGDGVVDSTNNSTVSHTYSAPGTYWASLEILTQGGCSNIYIDTVNVPPTTPCSAGFSHVPDTSGQYTILATNTSTGNNLSYLWNFGDGSTSTLAYPVHQYAGAGTYHICLSVTQANPACTDTYCDSVTVTQKQAMAFTFGVFDPATAIPDEVMPGDGLIIAPHPVSDQVHLTLSSQENLPAHVMVYNAFGQRVMNRELDFDAGRAAIAVADLPNGMYVLRVGTQYRQFWIQR